jgi:hypothetical protein
MNEARSELQDFLPSVCSDKDVVNALPAGTICPSTVNQNNIANAMLFVLRGDRSAGQQQ